MLTLHTVLLVSYNWSRKLLNGASSLNNAPHWNRYIDAVYCSQPAILSWSAREELEAHLNHIAKRT